MKTFLSKAVLSVVFCVTVIANGFCQPDTTKKNHYDDLSLKDLLDIKIVSVSKKTELLFDAPLSASVITREEMRRTGCTSIMEALRLVPGMIVREQSNGNYDIHLRGMDNVPPNSPFDVTSNTTTLVMIDGRPVSSYLRGGTYWEALPIDFNDVERIEVIRGPAAALYGPNAVNGVINIITRQPQKDGLYIVANGLEGSDHTFINNASIGYRFNKKWNVLASGNYQSRNRTQTSYFEFTRNTWLDQPDYFLNFSNDTVKNVDTRYPDPNLAMNKYGGNLFLNYEKSEKMKFNLSVGAQHSIVQKVSTENEITPLSTASSGSRYADFRATVNKFSTQFSYNSGTQATDYDPGRKYDFTLMEGGIEYNYTKGNFSIKPGISYTSAVYDDRKYSDLILKNGLFNARGQITTQRGSIRSEYKLLNQKLRLVAGFTGDKFNYPDTTYISYEFAATYKLSKNQLFRIVYSSAPRSSNIFDTYVSKVIAYYPTGYKNFTMIAAEGNPNVRLLTADMLEFGYRGTIAPGLNIDVELFKINAENYTTPVNGDPYIQLKGTDTIQVVPIKSTNIPLELHQKGVTVSLTYNSKKLQVKNFITIQQTRAENYAPFINTPDADTPGAAQNNIYSGIGNSEILKSTPAVFGGGTVNYVFGPKINVNLSAYYYASQTYQHLSNIVFHDGVRGIDHIPAKLILNANVSYEPTKGLYLFCTGKNILNNASREFFKTDAVPFMLLGGLHYEF